MLHPDLTDETDYPTREAGSCAPFVWDEASVRPVWQRLAERAAALGQPAPQRETTTDPELRIVAKGRTVRPLYRRERSVHLRPAEGCDARCGWSRAPARRPTRARGWRIAAGSACMWSASCCAARARCARFRSTIRTCRRAGGRWSGTGTALRRWTDGEAVLPLPAMDGPTMLEIRAGSGGMTMCLTPTRTAVSPEVTDYRNPPGARQIGTRMSPDQMRWSRHRFYVNGRTGSQLPQAEPAKGAEPRLDGCHGRA